MKHRCYPIADLDFSGRHDAVALVAALADAGCSMVEVRAKHATGAVYYDYTRDAVKAAGKSCAIIVNDRLDVALAAGAAGVHLGENDIPVDVARRLAARPFIIGATCREPVCARRAEQAGADYLGVGAVFPTERKSDTCLIGLAGLAAVAAAVSIPVFAIAGVTAANCASTVDAGAWGASCIGAVAAADNPAAAWKKMEQSMNCGEKNR